MKKTIDIETERLVLRHWKEQDLEGFIGMNQDETVMRYFPKPMEPSQTMQFYQKIVQEFTEYGYGLYAAEEKQTGNFMGFIGFHWARLHVDFCPCIEIGWRLDKHYWGNGYATEGAAACLKYGFENLCFDKIYSFTAVENKASQRVMQKIGMHWDREFDHPALPENHPLRPHVCYCVEKDQWWLPNIS